MALSCLSLFLPFMQPMRDGHRDLPVELRRIDLPRLQRERRADILRDPNLRGVRVPYANFEVHRVPDAPLLVTGAALVGAALIFAPLGVFLAASGAAAIGAGALSQKHKITERITAPNIVPIDLSLEECLNLLDVTDGDAVFFDPNPLVRAGLVNRS